MDAVTRARVAMSRPLSDLVHESWLPVLEPHEDTIRGIGDRLRAEHANGRPWCPPGSAILRAFADPLDDVQVLIVGQDPYPTPGHAMGLAFSVNRDVRPLPRSLQNIYRELHDDVGCQPADHGDLTSWSRQGVLLLNRVLTVGVGQPASHQGFGWEAVTAAAIAGLAAREAAPLVAILWGRHAQSAEDLLPDVPVLTSAHPSPMSADRGFFGSRPFSAANQALEDLGGTPIIWQVE